MAVLKQNIWLLFKVIALVATVIFLAFVYRAWQKGIESVHREHEHALLLTKEIIQSTLLQQSVLLDVVGNKLIETKAQTLNLPVEALRAFLDQIIELDPIIIGFGLARPDGQLVLTSSNLNQHASILPNLLTSNNARKGFLLALNTDVMVVGQPYFMDVLDSQVLPVRKRLVSPNGQIEAVMTAGLNVTLLNRLLQNVATEGNRQIVIYSDMLKTPLLSVTGKGDISGKGTKPERYAYVPSTADSAKHRLEFDDAKRTPPVITSHLSEAQFGLSIYVHSDYQSVIRTVIVDVLPIFIMVVLLLLVMLFITRNVDSHNRMLLDKLRYQAETDMLTKMPNRYGLLNYHAKRDQSKPFSALFIDLSKFKYLNDSLGHQAGDEALKIVAQRISQSIDAEDMLVRFGGDEFVAMTDDTDKARLEHKAMRIINAIEVPIHVGNTDIDLWANVGIAKFPEHGTGLMEVISAADLAMYEAKSNALPMYFFDPVLQQTQQHITEMENDIIAALKGDEFYLVFQPQIDRSGKVTGVEALLRWQHPTRGLVSPAEFIPIAETRGLMPQLGEHILRLLVAPLKQFQAILSDPLSVSINVSVSQFTHPAFTQILFDTLGKIDGVSPNLVLEVTESLFISEPHEINRILRTIKSHGMHVSLDDFGTGYSSLSLLRNLEIDELKIDRSFVAPIEEDDTAYSVVSSVVSIGHTLNMTVLAEGVETQRQFQLLKRAGCDYFQGYLFAHPLKADELIPYIEKTNRKAVNK